jgi:transmembrane sensor
LIASNSPYGNNSIGWWTKTTMVNSSKQDDDAPSPDEQAIRWLVLLRSGTAAGFDRENFENWSRQSEENRLAFAQAEALWHQLDCLQPVYEQRHRRRCAAPIWKRTAWAGLAAFALAAVFVGVLHGGEIPRLTSEVMATAKAERKDVVLKDGTVIHMNADTAVVAETALWTRRYRLERGEAVFDVVHNSHRPFEVIVAKAVIHDLGTRFDVRHGKDGSRLSVFEGSVDLTASDGVHRRVVAAGQEVHFDGSGISPSSPTDERLLTAWRNGRFRFADSPLEDVVEQLNRYRSNRIVIRDTAIADLRVSGSFDIGNVDGVLHALELALPVVARNDPVNEQVLLVSKSNATPPKHQP